MVVRYDEHGYIGKESYWWLSMLQDGTCAVCPYWRENIVTPPADLTFKVHKPIVL